MTILLAFLAILFVYAYGQAWRDFLAVSLEQAIDHGERLKERLWVAGVWWLICAALGVGVFNVKWYDALLWIPMGWAWWTAWFRFLLNAMRGKDWRYVSPSNWYDTLWMRIAIEQSAASIEFGETWKEFIPRHRKDFPMIYSQGIHRSGLLAYAFEGLVFAGSVLVYALW